MKLLQEIALTVFSIIILVVSILMSVVIFGWLDFNIVNNMVNGIIASETLKNTVLLLNLVFIILSLVGIFYDSEKNTNSKDGILLENEKGNLLISRSALVKIIDSVVGGFESVQINHTKIELDAEGKLGISIQISVTKDVVIKELTNNLQIKIKEAIKKSSDLEVKTVNIAIQSIVDTEKTKEQA